MHLKNVTQVPTFLLMLFVLLGFIIGYIASFFGNTIFYLEQLNYLVIHGFYYELFTSIFITNSFIDFIFNFISLYILYLIFGARVGKHEYAIFILSGILGNIFSLYLYPPLTLSSGASGGIFGLLSFYTFYDFISGGTLGIYGLVFLLSVFGLSDLLFPNVDIFAHIGGIIGGIIYAVAYRFISHGRKIN